MANKRIKDLSTTAAVTASDDFIAVDGATNGTRKLDAYSPTFGGNLTVSGNGLNTFGGTGTTNASILFGASNVANTSAGYLSISQRSNYGYALFGWNMTGTSGSDAYTSPKNATGSAGVELIGGSSGITRFIYSTAVTTAGSTLTVTEAARFSSGNLLLKSDGIDSGNGKIQLATHTTSAGGIGFGTGLSLFTSSASVLDLSVSSGTPTLRFLNGTTVRGSIGTSGTTLSVQSDGGSIILASNGTTALTLDSSQNATFAGKVTVSKANAGLDTSVTVNNTDSAANSTSSLILTSVAGSWTIQNNRSGGHLYFKDPATSATQLQINNSTGLATFAGAIAIGNTVQTAASVVSTHKVTISIGGVTYYLLATNV